MPLIYFLIFSCPSDLLVYVERFEGTHFWSKLCVRHCSISTSIRYCNDFASTYIPISIILVFSYFLIIFFFTLLLFFLTKGNVTPQQRASYTKWVVWANSELDGLCFGKNMGGTQLDKPNKALDTLEKILSKSDYLVNNEFSVADVAVASYLNYVPIFFGGSLRKLPNRPFIGEYMKRCAARPAFISAFGEGHSNQVMRIVS